MRSKSMENELKKEANIFEDGMKQFTFEKWSMSGTYNK